MSFETESGLVGTPIYQLSIFAENKVGRLNELIGILGSNNVHILSICSSDTTDSSIIRLIVDYTEQAEALLEENTFPYTKEEVVCVEIPCEGDLRKVSSALIQAEINIHYIFPLLMRPHGMCGLVLRVEDNELSRDVLKAHKIKVLSREDITR